LTGSQIGILKELFSPAIHCSALSHAAERRYAAGGFLKTSQFHPSEKDYHAVFLGKKGGNVKKTAGKPKSAAIDPLLLTTL